MFLKKNQKESPKKNFSAGLCKKLGDSRRVTETGALKVMFKLHETIRNDNF